MTITTRRPKRDGTQAVSTADALTKHAMRALLGHRSPTLSSAVYRYVTLPDRLPEVRATADGSAVRVAFIAGGQPYLARLPKMSIDEARFRAMKAYRLARIAREYERRVDALLRVRRLGSKDRRASGLQD